MTSHLTDEQVRAALEWVARPIDPDTRVMVGHSLGSVVAYEAAHRTGHHRFAAGLRAMGYEGLRPNRQASPGIARWVTLADRNHFVATAPDPHRPIWRRAAGRGTAFGWWTIHNGAEPHPVTFYLTKQQTSRHPTGRPSPTADLGPLIGRPLSSHSPPAPHPPHSFDARPPT